MTVASKLKKTYATLQGAETTISTYANHHPNADTRDLMKNCREKIKGVNEELAVRIREIENEEGQYKGF